MTEKQFNSGKVLCPCCQARMFFRDQPWKKVCVACYLERNPEKRRPAESVPAAAGIEPTMLRRLVQLCHPDRHGNSEASNIATRYLLDMRGR